MAEKIHGRPSASLYDATIPTSLMRKEETLMISKRICSRILLCSASALLASMTAIAQSQPGGGQQPMPSQQTPSPGMGSPGTDTSSGNQQALVDQSFVRKALEGGAAEVQLGQLVQQKSQSDDVKQFGQKMVEDHTQLGDQLMKPIFQHGFDIFLIELLARESFELRDEFFIFLGSPLGLLES